MSEDVVSSLSLGLLVFGVGYIVVKLFPKMWERSREKSSVEFEHYDEGEKHDRDPTIKIDAKKKFCQQMKFAIRIKRQMKRFKQRKLATGRLNSHDSTTPVD